MQSVLSSEHQKSLNSGPSVPYALWPVDLRLTHLDWNPEATLIHFQGQYHTICELDYTILQGEIQNIPKTKAVVDVGEFCLVEDLTSARWYRGRVQNRKEDLFDVYLIDHGNVLSVDISHISSCSNELFILPPKIVCGFLANVLLLQDCSHSVVEGYFSNLIGRNVTGYIQAFLPHKVLLLEASDINIDLVRHGFGRHVDTDTFLLLVEMLTEVPLKQNLEPVPDLLIEKPRGQEFSFSPPGLQGYEDILSFCGPRLSCGTRVKVRVTAAVKPGLFYCQRTSMDTDLWEMSQKLAAVCEHRTKEHNQETPENLGLLCAVKGKDGKWHRGFVQFLPVNSHVRVLFIDYGFFESVKVDNVHRLTPDFYSPPIMAFPCSLSSLNDQDESVKTQQLSFLKAGLLGRLLDVEIRSFDEGQHLYSITVIGAEDNHVKAPEPILEHPRTKVETEQVSPQCGYLNYETIMGEELGKTVEAEEVTVDSVFVGYVEHVQNPNHFWIRTQKRNDEFEEMMTKMADHFSQVKLDEDVLLNPELGTMCCAVYEEDMHFYRGVVTDTLVHGAEVFFIDFGNIEKVPYMLIKKIPETFASKSAFAFCCTLVNVFPLDEVWTSNASDFFKRAVSNKALLVNVVQMRKNKFVVDLYEIGSDNNQSISKLLISSKQADYWNNIPIQPVVQNNKDVSETTRCPRYSLTSDINGNAEQLEEEKMCKKEINKAQPPVIFKELSIKPGCEFAVCCSYISSPSEFWCQPLDKVPALEELMAEVQQYYSTHTVPHQSGDSCCVAKSPQDGRWYRGVIIEKQKSLARVMLVDYGYTIQIKEHNLQAVMPEYVYLEGQAFRCSLYNLIEPADPKNCGKWSPEVCNLLKDFVLCNTGGLRCKVVSQWNVKNKGLCNVVDLYKTQTQQSITDLLLEKGLAREVTFSTKQLSMMFPESFVYSSYDLSPGKEEQVFITHVSSQWEVYCQLERNSEIIEELEKKISEESEKMMKASTRAVLRKLCLAKYFDGKWYRGLAHPVESPLHLGVFFVDFGNVNISEKTQVMFIPRDSDLLYTPMQAVRCSLASVSKEDLYADVNEWLDGTILNKQVRAIIVEKTEDGSFSVELFDGDVNINEKVKELILSLSPKPKTVVSFDISSTKTKCKTSQRRNPKASLKCMSHQHKRRSSISPTLNAHRGTTVGRAPCKKKDYTKNWESGKAHNKNTKVKQQNDDNTKSCVPLKFQKSSPVKQQRDCRDTKTKSEQPQYTKETDVPQLSCLPDVKVSAGFRALCFVSHIDSVLSFFLQLSEDEPAILKMGEDLNSSTLRDSLKTATSLRIDDLVLAEYEEDGGLYRSAVKDYEGSSCFKVEFVDYGNSTVVKKEKIYSIPKEYLPQPRFCVSCSLLDPRTYKNDASFTDAVMEKPLMVDFVRPCGNQWVVKVEILDGTVGLPAAVEAAVESSTETEKEEEAPASSPVIEEKVRPCEQNDVRKGLSENEITKSEKNIPTFDRENLLKQPAATRSPKLKVVTCLRHRRTPIRNMVNSKKNQRKLVKSSVKAKRDCADAVKPPTIQAGDTENGTVLSVLSNSYFYIRLNKTSDLLVALESRIADLYKCEMVAEEDVKQGLKCLVQLHKDKQWHRAVVQHVGRGKCQVLFVDHGITEEIPSGSIRRQCRDLTKIPSLAVLCKMNCLGFSEVEGAYKLWHETLKPMIGKEVKLVFVCYSEADQLWMVEIVINGLFLIRQITTSLQQNEELMSSPAETRNEKADGIFNLETSPPQQLLVAPIDIDKAYSGFASAVTTPVEFCVVLEDLHLVMNRVSMMMDDLPGTMSPLPEAHLVPGTCCLLKSDTQNKWCRAEIVHADTTAVLNLVDYGLYEYMPYEDCSKLKRLPEEIMNLPKVTYPCILRGVKPVGVDGQWTDEAAFFFQQCLYQKNLEIFFREFVSNTHWKVDILADGVHVAEKLVDAGHAKYIDIVLELRFQQQKLCNAAPHSHDSEEECGQEDEGSYGKSDLTVESTDEAKGKMPLSVVPQSGQCFLM
ncbi:tudor domain-containing protein 15 [Micropterus dolomieu]|uniref:tudor domain-containing protein 15 n=1 Tax=Micropterus dolomieu TaxID=147949 RepID=UPI001E8E7BFA|nr:tudor domain-containing protein 15 [Micropterus dolomieu]XP_045916333.1 tudor domain-containing protein 15 [Micropterus dolomieu]XP_045916334.1 tudor domain-containing protein 15 [Micropterus dolomieu]XP_045916335.1 tudor domain-containing protein 15 [Micropterus dolomieu]